MKNDEFILQRNVMRYINANVENYPALAGWYHVPNGARYKSTKEGVRMKLMGVKPGVPDLMHPGKLEPICTHPHLLALKGYAIECKSEAGKLSPEQKWWKAYLLGLGYQYLSSCDEIEIKEWIKVRFFSV